MRTFRLYPEPARWWSIHDYAAVVEVVERVRPARVLEFGPGSSTLALIEGGAGAIDSCEDNPDWARVYRARLQSRFPSVRIVPYDFANPLTIPLIDGERYDLALVDGPHGTDNRPAVVEYCLQRCERVLVCTEDDAPEGARNGAPMPIACYHLAAKYRRRLEFNRTGPLAGGFALIGPAC